MANLNRKPTEVDIKYRKLEEGERLYDDVEYYGTTKIVEAEYSPSEQFPGNPLVEALPAPRSAVELYLEGQKEIPDYNYEKLIHSPLSVQIGHLVKLRSLKYIMPYQPILESAFHMALVKSYSHRTFLESNTKDIEVKVNNNALMKTNRILVGNPASGTFGGFALIGDSGSGKTTGLDITTSGYPQVLVHPLKDGSTFTQILYIVVNCPTRSNFRALLQAIGKAVDRALGLISPYYEELLTVKPRDNLGVAITKTLREIIERLAIGMIIIDEFQNMQLDPSMENSMNSLLFLGNDTKNVYGVVGTKYSKNKLFNMLDVSLQSHRRFDVEVPADNYCSNKEFVYGLIKWLFRYQLFDPRVRLRKEDDPICEALYECSKGIVDQIVSIFTYMNLDFIMKKGTPEEPSITPEFVKEVAEKYFPTIQKILQSKNRKELTPEEEAVLKDQRDLMEEELKRLQMERESCESEINEIHAMMSVIDEENEELSLEDIRNKAMAAIALVAGTKYNEETIRKKVDSCIKQKVKKEEKIVLQDVIREASGKLMRAKTNARSNYSPSAAQKSADKPPIDISSVIVSDVSSPNAIFDEKEE